MCCDHTRSIFLYFNKMSLKQLNAAWNRSILLSEWARIEKKEWPNKNKSNGFSFSRVNIQMRACARYIVRVFYTHTHTLRAVDAAENDLFVWIEVLSFVRLFFFYHFISNDCVAVTATDAAYCHFWSCCSCSCPLSSFILSLLVIVVGGALFALQSTARSHTHSHSLTLFRSLTHAFCAYLNFHNILAIQLLPTN